MNRRNFIYVSATGVTAASVLGLTGCGGKSIGPTVAIITGAISALKPLFPSRAADFDKIVQLATDFNNDWTKGLFDSAKVAFENLDTLMSQVIDVLGVGASTKVQLLLATLGIALRTIAAIIAEQSPVVAAKAKAAAPQAVNRINVLADPGVAAALLKATKP